MNVKKFVLAWLAAVAIAYLVGFGWHMFLMGDFYQAQSQALAREEPNFVFLFVGPLILYFLMALVYPIGYKGDLL